jgi:hypothetical protein
VTLSLTVEKVLSRQKVHREAQIMHGVGESANYAHKSRGKRKFAKSTYPHNEQRVKRAGCNSQRSRIMNYTIEILQDSILNHSRKKENDDI